MSSSISTYLFDFDGTLVDSMPYWSRNMINILKNSNVTYPDDIIKIITPLGNVGTAKYFKEVLNVKLSIEEIISLMDEYNLPYYRDHIVLKDGVRDYLEMLKQNNCSLNVLTASPHKILDPCLKRNGVWDLFDNVWSCNDFSTSKSNPQIYVDACKRIGSEKCHTAFFDDNIGALETAARAGLYTVGVYDESGKDFTEQLKQSSDMYIESFRQLRAL